MQECVFSWCDYSEPMRVRTLAILLLCLCVFARKFLAEAQRRDIAQEPTLMQRYERIRNSAASHGPGGLAVLDMAYKAMSDSRLAGLEDLWATALKEGRTLFRSDRLWKATGPGETGDMLGQTTIGPWQITIENAREYGSVYGVQSDWSTSKVAAFLEQHPELQAKIAHDFIEESYRNLGRRTPMAIQRYFWLDGYLQKKIGQGPWHASVLAKPGAMENTGFYAKQLLLGSRFNPQGLLYWLYISEDKAGIQETLRTWFDAGYPVTESDLAHCSCDPKFQEFLKQSGWLSRQTSGEK